MIHGVGVDIISNERFRDSSLNESFLDRTYSSNELIESKSRNDPHQYLISRFAAKEAVFKSLNCSSEDICLAEIEILTKSNFQPVVHLSGKTAKLSNDLNIKNIKLSISYETDYTVAFAIAETRCDT
ncbi:holo-ACP synthase [Enterococcus casseliflavus]